MSDFSYFSLFTAGLAFMVPVAHAFTYNTQPVGSSPVGNPIAQPGLNSVVPVGANYTITWNPTTPGNVDLILLKGPATNAVPQLTIVSNIPNTGTYVWLPSTDLAPSDASNPAQGYGIQLIVDSNGAYQYTTQFGISNPGYKAPSSTSSSATSSAPASSTSGAGSYPSASGSESSGVWYITEVVSAYTSYYPHASSGVVKNVTATIGASSTSGPISTGTGTAASSGYFPASNSTIVKPTGSLTVPSSLLSSVTLAPVTTAAATTKLRSSSSAVASASASGAAAANVATSFGGLVFAAGMAVLAL